MLRVSSEVDISDDEEDETDYHSNDSFIDDRINCTTANTQAATSGIDMMAVYRSLSLFTSVEIQGSIKVDSCLWLVKLAFVAKHFPSSAMK